MKSAGKARNNGLYRHIRTSKEIIRNLLNDYKDINATGPGYGKLPSTAGAGSSVLFQVQFRRYVDLV